MKVETSQIKKLKITGIERLDPVSVIFEDFGPGQGKIIIECYGKAWSAYWGGMGDRTISEFFCSCDDGYLSNNLSNINSSVYDEDKIREDAKQKGIECWCDDPWNDHEFMTAMYGSEMHDWSYQLPTKTNPDYEYLCRIIHAVQDGIKLSSQEVTT